VAPTDESFPERYGRWALVAGASEGLGAAFAGAAAARGLDVVVLARRRRELEETAGRIADEHGVQVRPVVVDMADPDVGRIVAEATDDVEVGLFVYNAAASPQGKFLDVSLDEHLVGLRVNCITPTVLAHRLGKRMTGRGRGAIVLVTSMAALQGTKVFASYAAAKAYELILGEGMWDELRDDGVDVVSYVVGATATPTMLSSINREGGSLADASVEPRTPESVAGRVLEHLHDGPRVYSHPDDERAADASATKPRAETVAAMGRVTSKFWA
jgi:short-subunit dehydrogenase